MREPQLQDAVLRIVGHFRRVRGPLPVMLLAAIVKAVLYGMSDYAEHFANVSAIPPERTTTSFRSTGAMPCLCIRRRGLRLDAELLWISELQAILL